MIQSDLYTAVDVLHHKNKNRTTTRSLRDAKECHSCCYIYTGFSCDNCLGFMTKPSASSRLA